MLPRGERMIFSHAWTFAPLNSRLTYPTGPARRHKGAMAIEKFINEFGVGEFIFEEGSSESVRDLNKLDDG